MTFLPRPPLAGAFHVNCRLPVIDSQKFCGLICSRERGYSRCRRLRTVLDLAPACLARHWLGLFLCRTNGLQRPSSFCVQGCPVAQLQWPLAHRPRWFFDPRRGHFSTVGLRESAIPSNGGSANPSPASPTPAASRYSPRCASLVSRECEDAPPRRKARPSEPFCAEFQLTPIAPL
jgi:hypothetical protein